MVTGEIQVATSGNSAAAVFSCTTLTIKRSVMGQTNMHNYMKPLLARIEQGQIDPSYIISHRIGLD